MRAGADDIAVRQKPFVVDRIDLRGRPFFQQPVDVELVVEMLRDLVVLLRMRATEVIEGKTETISKIFLNGVHLRAIRLDREAGFVRRQFGRSAMFVRGADKQHFVSARALKSRVNVRRQHRADEITQVLYPMMGRAEVMR